jgi:hypothetical protein
MAQISDKSTGQTSACPHMNTTFSDRMVFSVDSSTNKHTGETTYTFIHFIRFNYLGQIISSNSDSFIESIS